MANSNSESGSPRARSLADDTKAQARSGIQEVGNDFGMSDIDYGGVGAEYSRIDTDIDGNATRAEIFCDRACQREAGDQGRIRADDLSRAAMQISIRNSSRQAAIVSGTALAVPLAMAALSEGGIYAAAWLANPRNLQKAKTVCQAAAVAALCSIKGVDGKVEFQLPKGIGSMFRDREAIRRVREVARDRELIKSGTRKHKK